MSNRPSEFIPNSFQTPNIYVDSYLHLLSGEEWKVLTYAIRRILGFNKRSDRISLSQFSEGIVNRQGVRLDYGCGLNVDTIRTITANLCEYGFLIRLQENDPHLNTGPEYGLQLDDTKINLSAILQRKTMKEKANQVRTKRARNTLKGKRQQYPLLSDNTTPPIVGQYSPPIVGQTHNNQETQGNPDSLATLEEIALMSVAEARKVPEIKLYEEVTGGFPGKYQWMYIVESIRLNHTQKETMITCWAEWAKRGYKPNNLGWLLEWCVSGIKDNHNGHKNNHKARPKSEGGQSGSHPEPSAADLELAREIRAKRNGSHV